MVEEKVKYTLAFEKPNVYYLPEKMYFKFP